MRRFLAFGACFLVLGSFTLFVGVSPTVAAAPPPVSAVLASDKQSYANGETVVLTLSLTNSSSQTLFVTRASIGTTKVVKFLRDGKAVKPKKATFSPNRPATEIQFHNIVPISPAGSVTVPLAVSTRLGALALEVTKLISKDKIDSGYQLLAFDMSSPGEYSVQLAYRYKDKRVAEQTPSLYQKTVKSNLLRFTRQP